MTIDIPATGTASQGAKTAPHAAIRALERYGLKLTSADLGAIAAICKAGGGRTGTLPGNREFHTVIYGDRVLYVVYRRTGGRGVVLTCLPSARASLNVYRHGAYQRWNRTHETRKRPDQ